MGITNLDFLLQPKTSRTQVRDSALCALTVGRPLLYLLLQRSHLIGGQFDFLLQPLVVFS